MKSIDSYFKPKQSNVIPLNKDKGIDEGNNKEKESKDIVLSKREEAKMFFPYLYKTNENGKDEIWKVWVIEDILMRSWGLVDGKMQMVERKYDFTNKGKSNEMSPFQTACSHAESKWASQVDKGYKPKESDSKGMDMYNKLMEEKVKHGGSNFTATAKGKKTVRRKVDDNKVGNLEFSIFPMLCDKWNREKEEKSIKDLGGFPFYIEPKYDGMRCVARMQDGKVVLTSRSNKEFSWLTNIREEIKIFLNDNPEIILDGELYRHDLYDENGVLLKHLDRFNLISEICKMNRKVPHPLENKIGFMVYDIINHDETQEDRNKGLKILHNRYMKNKNIGEKEEKGLVYLSEKNKVNNKEEMFSCYNKLLEEGYEGVVLRKIDLKYSETWKDNKRPKGLLKLKPFDDAEFLIVGIKEGASLEHYSWICVMPSYKNKEGIEVKGKEFCADTTGKKEVRIENNKNRDKFIGKYATISFNGYTASDETGVPRFAKFLRVRDVKEIV